MLHEQPHLSHQVCHLNLTAHTKKTNSFSQIQLLHEGFCLREQGPFPHHPQLTIGLGSEGTNRVKRTLLGHKTPHRQTDRRRLCRRAAMKQLGIRSRCTDQDAIRRRTQCLQCLSHGLGFADQPGRQPHQAAIPAAQNAQLALRREIGATEMHHQGHCHRWGRLHHPHRMKAKLSKHQIGLMASNQQPRHHGCRPSRQAQKAQACQCLTHQHCKAVCQPSWLVPGAFIAEVGLHLKRQPGQIGTHEGF